MEITIASNFKTLEIFLSAVYSSTFQAQLTYIEVLANQIVVDVLKSSYEMYCSSTVSGNAVIATPKVGS